MSYEGLSGRVWSEDVPHGKGSGCGVVGIRTGKGADVCTASDEQGATNVFPCARLKLALPIRDSSQCG